MGRLTGRLQSYVGALIEAIARFPERSASGSAVVSADTPWPAAGSRRAVALRFGTERAVVKRIAVPASARDVLAAIIDNKIEGLAPWPAPSAIWGYRVLDTGAGNQLDVEVGIISRKLLDSTLRDAEAAGLTVSHAEIGDGASHGIVIDFRKPERVLRWQRRLRTLATAAAVTCLGVGGFGLYKGIAAQQELSAIEERATVLQQTLLGNTPASAEGAQLAAANALHARKRAAPPVVQILNDLTGLVPDGTWLNSFEYSASRITITGNGVNVTRLINDLEASPAFESAGFSAATQRDAASGSDTFAISAGVAAQEAAP